MYIYATGQEIERQEKKFWIANLHFYIQTTENLKVVFKGMMMTMMVMVICFLLFAQPCQNIIFRDEKRRIKTI
jgi:hypothetical protein